jgi:hypothetical protein
MKEGESGDEITPVGFTLSSSFPKKVFIEEESKKSSGLS